MAGRPVRVAGFIAAMIAAVAATAGAAQAQPARPNIVVIVVDDAALMDFGVYGGEAHTPNIDALAAAGAMLTSYHSSPLCSPSRAMLLTGVDSHRTGVSTIEEVLPPEQRGKPGYSLRLEPGVLTLADRLKQAGYRTLMSGKWHLGHGPGDLPDGHGFDRSLALDASGADNWAAKPYMPYYQTAPWFEDGKPAAMPASFYSSELIVDRMIGYIDEAEPGASPWMGYVAFQAVHIPVQAPRAFSDKYKGVFDAGWDVLREARTRRAVEAGLLPAGAAATPMPDTLRKWDTLSDDEKRIHARSMEVYSGMLEAMDHHIGRLVAHIAARGELDRTIFVVTSDNGPEPSDPVHAPWMAQWMALNGYDWKLETLGDPGSLAFIGPEWASAIAAPGSHYKFYASQGGLRVPMILSGPGVPLGARMDTPAFVTDVTPTLLELAGLDASTPAQAVAITGRSLLGALHGGAPARGDDEGMGFEVSGNAALFAGRYKIVRNMPPVGDGAWRLYDLSVDPGETTDLSVAQAELFQTMLARYAAYEAEMGVLPLPEGYEVERQVKRNAMARQMSFHGWKVAVFAGAVLALAAAAVWFFVRRRRAKAGETQA